MASFEVEDAEATVSEMRAKGVTFEEYDMPVAEVGGSKGGWFKDPDGNMSVWSLAVAPPWTREVAPPPSLLLSC